ncbi:hypothetical protein Syun_029304 [Stephania yunnanensis]|uniref:Uncharacterized protein n=1 Tax=Stephania yunnanensis TaxID=152371 RepID=A0AAP0HL92_9MAGN
MTGELDDDELGGGGGCDSGKNGTESREKWRAEDITTRCDHGRGKSPRRALAIEIARERPHRLRLLSRFLRPRISRDFV